MNLDQLYKSYDRLNRLLWHPCTRKRRLKVQRLMRKHRARGEALMRADRTLPQYNFDYVTARYEVRFAHTADSFRVVKVGPPPTHDQRIIHPDDCNFILPIIYRRLIT